MVFNAQVGFEANDRSYRPEDWVDTSTSLRAIDLVQGHQLGFSLQAGDTITFCHAPPASLPVDGATAFFQHPASEPAILIDAVLVNRSPANIGGRGWDGNGPPAMVVPSILAAGEH